MTHSDSIKPAPEHTPGPWVYTLDATGICGIHQANNDTGVPVRIAEVVSHSQKQVEADARLIASAPELLETLEAASDWIDAQLFVPRLDIQAKVRAALAKAKGGGR